MIMLVICVTYVILCCSLVCFMLFLCFVFFLMFCFMILCFCVFFFKQNTVYDMRISDWSSDVCSSDLKDLAESVFSNVFPKLIAAIPLADPKRPAEINAAYAEEVRSSALFLLYRLLFILYAEDRNLLPDETGPYSPYCLTRLRQEIEQLDNEGRKPLERSHAYWSRLETIFGAIAEGDDSLGIPPYNGGLFDAAESPLLSRIRLPDTVLAEVILALSHRREDGRLRYINYRDLSVQQLGSIYESILEYGVEPDLEARSVKPRADNQARHRSGSYYTPEPLVSLI